MSKAPGVMVVSWLSYSDSRRTLCNPVKLSLWTQLILLFLSILKEYRRTPVQVNVSCQERAAACPWGGRHSQHTQPLQPAEHAAPHRVDLIGGEV